MKVIKLIFILPVISIWAFLYNWLYILTGCYIVYGDQFLEPMYCKGREVIDSGIISYVIRDNYLIIQGAEIYFPYPKICYSNKQVFYVYDYWENKFYSFYEQQFKNSVYMKYRYPDDFYQLPDNYIERVGNCVN